MKLNPPYHTPSTPYQEAEEEEIEVHHHQSEAVGELEAPGADEAEETTVQLPPTQLGLPLDTQTYQPLSKVCVSITIRMGVKLFIAQTL